MGGWGHGRAQREVVQGGWGGPVAARGWEGPGSLLCSFVFLPRQLKYQRVGDGEVILATEQNSFQGRFNVLKTPTTPGPLFHQSRWREKLVQRQGGQTVIPEL